MDLFFGAPNKRPAAKLSALADAINARFGEGTVFFAAEGTERKWRMKRKMLSGCLPQDRFRPSASQTMILVSANGLDRAVNACPKTYRDTLVRNDVGHLRLMIFRGDRGGGTLAPHMYNFMRHVFKG